MKKAILFSSILHLLVLGLLIISCMQIFQPIPLPISYKNIIPVYFISTAKQQTHNPIRRDTQFARLNSKSEKVQARDAHVGRLDESNPLSKNVQHVSSYPTPSQANPSADFPSLLHTLIQNAVEMHDEVVDRSQIQSVQVEFLVFPDGHLENIHIRESSNHLLFDQAALDAVHSVQPISFAPQFLQQPQTFRVQIVFSPSER